MLELLRLTRGGLPGIFTALCPFKFTLSEHELFHFISDLSFPVHYLKSVLTEDLFGMPQRGLCFKEEAYKPSISFGASLHDKCAS